MSDAACSRRSGGRRKRKRSGGKKRKNGKRKSGDLRDLNDCVKIMLCICYIN